jgi:hypothetical protein
MAERSDLDFLDYYQTYCEHTIWFRKIVLRDNTKNYITVKDIAGEFIAERNRILLYIPRERRFKLRRNLNKIATSYYTRISHWSKTQKITIDMV